MIIVVSRVPWKIQLESFSKLDVAQLLKSPSSSVKIVATKLLYDCAPRSSGSSNTSTEFEAA